MFDDSRVTIGVVRVGGRYVLSEVLTQVGDGVGWVTLNRPHRMNAVTVELALGLAGALRLLGEHRDVNAIVVRGADGNFCSGGDFDEVQRLRAAGPAALATLFAAFGDACAVIAQIDVPVIAAVRGAAMAGGFELMQAADFALVSEDARIGDNHINVGMIPGGGSTARLPRIVGRQTALGLLLSGDRLSGAEAAARGLAYRCFPDAEFDAAVAAFAAKLAARHRGAVSTIKRLVYTGIDRPLADALADEADHVVRHIGGRAGADGIAAFDNREVRQ